MKDPVKLTIKKFEKIDPTSGFFYLYSCFYEVQDEKNVSYVNVRVGQELIGSKNLDEKTAEQVAFWFLLEDAKREIHNGNFARGEQLNPVRIICNEPIIEALSKGDKDKKLQEWINTSVPWTNPPTPDFPYTMTIDIPPDKIGFASQKRK